MENVDQRIIDYAKTCKNGEMTTEGFKASIDTMTFSAKAGKVALQALATVGNMFAMLAITKGIELAITAIDNWIHRAEKANEAMDAAVGEYESAKSSLENVNSELDEQNKKMDELLAKDKLTYTEKGQLEELQAITKELLLQQDIEERNTEKASKEAANKTVNAYQTQYGTYDASKDALNRKIQNIKETDIFPLLTGKNDVAGNIAAYIRSAELLEEAKTKYEAALNAGEDTDFLADNVQLYIDMVDVFSESLSTSLSDLQEKRLALEEEYNKAVEKRENNTEPLTSFEQDIISVYESIYETMKLVYEYTNQNTWNDIEISNIFNTEGIEKTKEELIEMAKSGELTPEVIASYQTLNKAIQDSEIFLKDGQTAAQAFCDEIYAGIETINKIGRIPTPISFDITTYKDKIDNIKSSISTLRSALDSFNKGDLSKIQVIDLIQEFPELAPYIDLTADGFGSLSEGLSGLIAQQPDSLVIELQKLKDSLSTDAEREQVDLLIDSLQRLSSYGDSGIEAYTTAIGNTWADTANVIEGVTTQFENLAKVQEMVAHGLTMTATQAAELAKLYPEILTNANVSAKGQITLNKDVVENILSGDKSIIGSQIAKLEADKEELEAKRAFSQAQLEIVRSVGEGEGEISRKAAENAIDIGNKRLKALIDMGIDAETAYAAAAEAMAGNMQEFSRIASMAAENVARNMADAADVSAQNFYESSIASQESMNSIQKKAWDVADAVAKAASGIVGGSSDVYHAGGSISKKLIRGGSSVDRFNAVSGSYAYSPHSLGETETRIEADIKKYTEAIADIDAQIQVLEGLQASLDGGGGIGGHGYADQIKRLRDEKSLLESTAGESAAKSAETFSWIEKAVSRVQRTIKNLGDTVSATWKSWTERNGALATQLNEVRKEISLQQSAYDSYMKKAESVGLPDRYKNLVRNGGLSIEDIADETLKEQIKEYQEWWIFATLSSNRQVKFYLIAGNPLEPYKLQRKHEIQLNVNV